MCHGYRDVYPWICYVRCVSVLTVCVCVDLWTNQGVSEGNDRGDIWLLCSSSSEVMSSPGWAQGKMLHRARTGQWVSLASIANRVGGNGTSVICQAPGRKVKYHKATSIVSRNKKESEKLELLNSPIYSLKVSYAWQTLQVASIISPHLSCSLTLFSPISSPTFSCTFSVLPSLLSVFRSDC